MTLIDRRGLLLGTAGGLIAAPAIVRGQSYPSRPLRILVGFSAGGSADATARIVAAEMSSVLGQQVVVENRTGATGNLATQAVLQATPDGHTLKFAQIHLATNPHLQAVGYDPRRDLQMISQLVSVPVLLLARADSELRSLEDVVRVAKARPGELNFGGVVGTSSHLAVELLAREAGFTYTFIPYRGGANAVQGLVGREVDLVFDLMSPVIVSNIAAGTLRAIAVMQDEPIAQLPSAVPAGRQGFAPATFFRSWQGLAVRAGTPAPIVASIFEAAARAVRTEAVATRLTQLGNEPHLSGSPAEFQAYYLEELDRMGELIRRLGLTRT